MDLYHRMLTIITEHRNWITRRQIALALSGGKHKYLNPHHVMKLSLLIRDGRIQGRKSGKLWEYKSK